MKTVDKIRLKLGINLFLAPAVVIIIGGLSYPQGASWSYWTVGFKIAAVLSIITGLLFGCFLGLFQKFESDAENENNLSDFKQQAENNKGTLDNFLKGVYVYYLLLFILAGSAYFSPTITKETIAEDKRNQFENENPHFGEYVMVMNDLSVDAGILTLTLKENGTGYFKNSEPAQYGYEPEYATFKYNIMIGEYRIKDGNYKYINIYSVVDNIGQIFTTLMWIIDIDNYGNISLRALTQSEELRQEYYLKKK